MIHSVFIFLFFFISCNLNNLEHPQINKAVLDLNKFDLKKSIIALDGQWKFFPNQLIHKLENLKPNYLVEVPSVWQNYKLDNQFFPAIGYGTFYLKMINTKNYSKKTRNNFSNSFLKINTMD